MLIKNKLDKTFGSAGTNAVIILFIAGLFVIFNSLLFGVILILLGTFIGFSSSGSVIDTDKKRIKFLNNLFGIIQSGKWMKIEESLNLGIKESNLTWTSYSRGNRAPDIRNRDYRIVLYDVAGYEIMEISKSGSTESARVRLEELAGHLGIGLI